jgi:hypothetical protein
MWSPKSTPGTCRQALCARKPAGFSYFVFSRVAD